MATASSLVPPPTTRLAAAPARAARPAARYLVAQGVGAFGLAAGGTSGGLLVADLTGRPAAAAWPVGVLALGAALSAPVLTGIMHRAGRRVGLVVGYLAAAAGATGVVVGVAVRSLWLILAASALLGAGNSAVMLTRYVLADAVPPGVRGRAVSRSLLVTVIGALVAPNLLQPAAELAAPLGLPEESGLYLVAMVVFAIAAVVLRPTFPAEPAVSAGPVSEAVPEARTGLSPAPAAAGRTRLAVVVLTTANAAMVSMMTVATVHLHTHGHDLAAIGLAVSLHVGGMFLPSPLAGQLCDRLGAMPVALAGAALLVVVGVTGAVQEPSGMAATSGLLLLLGVSWNLQVVAGTVLLTEAVPPAQRPIAEGRGELLMGLAAGTAALLGASPLAAVGGLQLLSAAVALVGIATATTLAVRLAQPPRLRQPHR